MYVRPEFFFSLDGHRWLLKPLSIRKYGVQCGFDFEKTRVQCTGRRAKTFEYNICHVTSPREKSPEASFCSGDWERHPWGHVATSHLVLILFMGTLIPRCLDPLREQTSKDLQTRKVDSDGCNRRNKDKDACERFVRRLDHIAPMEKKWRCHILGNVVGTLKSFSMIFYL